MRKSIDAAADQARLHAWLDTLPAVTAEFSGPLGRAPSYVRDELRAVWEWFRPYCVPGPHYHDPDPRDPLEVVDGIPAWAASQEGILVRRAFGVETLQAIDLVARFHAEVLLREFPQTGVVIFDHPGEEVDEDGAIALLSVPQDRNATGIVFLHRDVVVQAQRATFHNGYASDQLLKISGMRAARIAEVQGAAPGPAGGTRPVSS